MRRIILVSPGLQLKKNIHLTLFYQVLIKNGYQVLPFNIKNLIMYRNHAIWHIHWVDQFFRGSLQRFGIYKPMFFISITRIYLFLTQLLLAKLFKLKIIWSVHNISSHEYGETIYEKFVVRVLLSAADRVTAFNEFIRKKIEEKTNFKHVVVMRRGLYEGIYPEPLPKKKAKQLLNINQNSFTLLLFGALLPYKGVDILIKSIQKIKDEKIVLILAGTTAKNPAYGEKLRILSENDSRIILMDKYVSEKELPILFGAADYTIYPYRKISNSGVLFMSLTFGVPSIVSNKGGVREIIDLEPGAGILLDNPDAKNIVNAINLAKETKIDINAMNRIQKKLSWKYLEASILEAFQI
jgi:glycosyltransferase involved in cell wall biosynthesis